MLLPIFGEICRPAVIYLSFSLVIVLLSFLSSIPLNNQIDSSLIGSHIFRILAVLVMTWILGYICNRSSPKISWIFLFFTIIGTIITIGVAGISGIQTKTYYNNNQNNNNSNQYNNNNSNSNQYNNNNSNSNQNNNNTNSNSNQNNNNTNSNSNQNDNTNSNSNNNSNQNSN
jgi:predicted PurR-regulated permease PerM